MKKNLGVRTRIPWNWQIWDRSNFWNNILIWKLAFRPVFHTTLEMSCLPAAVFRL
jgi:hypothetical protein